MTTETSNALETSKVGRPRSADIPARRGQCAAHGTVELRTYKNGRDKQGKQRTIERCPACHAERNLASYHARKEQS